MRLFLSCCALAGVSACSDIAEPKSVPTELMDEVMLEGQALYGDKISFSNVYESNKAVCGNMTEDGKVQRFIYVRNRFLLEERSPSGEWESLWFTECDPS